MKKAAKIILVSVLVILVVAVASVFFFLNQIVHKGVETGGPRLLGVTTTLEEVDLRPLRGKFVLRELVVGSPEGFKSDHTFRLGSLAVDLDIRTVTKDTIIIRSVIIDAPDIICELGLGGSNLGQLMKNIEANTGGGAAPEETAEPAPDATEAAPARKVIIEKLVIQNGSIRVAAKLISAAGITVPLPRIELTDIGKEEEGASLPVVVARVLKTIITTVLQTVANSGKLVGTGLKAGADAALKGAEMGAALVGQGADLAIGAAGKSAEVAIGAAGKGAEMAIGAAGKATETVGQGLQQAGAVAGQTGAALGRGAGAAADVATKGVGAVAGTAAKGAGAVAGAATKGVGAAAGAVGKGAGAAVGAAGKAGATVGKGAAKVVGGITGLFGRNRSETEEAAANAQEEATTP